MGREGQDFPHFPPRETSAETIRPTDFYWATVQRGIIFRLSKKKLKYLTFIAHVPSLDFCILKVPAFEQHPLDEFIHVVGMVSQTYHSQLPRQGWYTN